MRKSYVEAVKIQKGGNKTSGKLFFPHKFKNYPAISDSNINNSGKRKFNG